MTELLMSCSMSMCIGVIPSKKGNNTKNSNKKSNSSKSSKSKSSGKKK